MKEKARLDRYYSGKREREWMVKPFLLPDEGHRFWGTRRALPSRPIEKKRKKRDCLKGRGERKKKKEVIRRSGLLPGLAGRSYKGTWSLKRAARLVRLASKEKKEKGEEISGNPSRRTS